MNIFRIRKKSFHSDTQVKTDNRPISVENKKQKDKNDIIRIFFFYIK